MSDVNLKKLKNQLCSTFGVCNITNEAIAYIVSECIKDYKQLEQENAELKAHCVSLLNTVTQLSNTYTITPEMHFELQELIKRTPQQSLANMQADAIEEFSNKYASCVSGKWRSYAREHAKELIGREK